MSESTTNNTISLLKDNLCKMRSNIAELQHMLSSNCASEIDGNNDLLLNTSALLQQVEQLPLSKIANKLQKIKVQRKNKAKKRAILKKQFQAKQKQSQQNSQKQNAKKVIPTAAKSKPHVQLRQQYDARRFLRRFELLTQLHAARASNSRATKAFACELHNLKAIWTQVLQQSSPQQASSKTTAEEWEEALFGAVQHACLDVTTKKYELKRRRKIWNSYQTRSTKRGSYLPSYPVLPPAEVNELWRAYLQQTP